MLTKKDMHKKMDAQYFKKGKEIIQPEQGGDELYFQSEMSMQWPEQEYDMRAKRTADNYPYYDSRFNYEPTSVYSYSEYRYSPDPYYETEDSQSYYTSPEQSMYRRADSVSEIESDFSYRYRTKRKSDHKRSQKKMRVTRPKMMASNTNRKREDLNVYAIHQPTHDQLFKQRKQHKIVEVSESEVPSMTKLETKSNEIMESKIRNKSPEYHIYSTLLTRNNTSGGFTSKNLQNQSKVNSTTANEGKVTLPPMKNMTFDSLHKIASKIVYLPVMVMNHEKSPNNSMKKPTLFPSKNGKVAEKPLENIQVYSVMNTEHGNLFDRTKNLLSKKNNSSLDKQRETRTGKGKKSNKNTKTSRLQKPHRPESSTFHLIEKKSKSMNKLPLTSITVKKSLSDKEIKKKSLDNDIAEKTTKDNRPSKKTVSKVGKSHMVSNKNHLNENQEISHNSSKRSTIAVNEENESTLMLTPRHRTMLSNIMLHKESEENRKNTDKINTDMEKTPLKTQIRKKESYKVIPEPSNDTFLSKQDENRTQSKILPNFMTTNVVAYKEVLPEISIIERVPLNRAEESKKMQDKVEANKNLPKDKSIITGRKSLMDEKKNDFNENEIIEEKKTWVKRKSKKFLQSEILPSILANKKNEKKSAVRNSSIFQWQNVVPIGISKYELEETIPLDRNRSLANGEQDIQKFQDINIEIKPEQKINTSERDITTINKSSAVPTKIMSELRETHATQINKPRSLDMVADFDNMKNKSETIRNNSLGYDEKSQNIIQENQPSISQSKDGFFSKSTPSYHIQQESLVIEQYDKTKTPGKSNFSLKKGGGSKQSLNIKYKEGPFNGRIMLWGCDLSILVYLYQIALYFIGVSMHDKFIEVLGGLN